MEVNKSQRQCPVFLSIALNGTQEFLPDAKLPIDKWHRNNSVHALMSDMTGMHIQLDERLSWLQTSIVARAIEQL
jgi:hypothetical protein